MKSRDARVVVPNQPPGSSSLHLLKQLHWLPVEWRIKFKIATLTFKALETGQPPYLAQQVCAYAPTRALHSSISKLLQVPRTNLRFGSRSSVHLLPLSGTHCLAAFISVNL